MDRIYQPDDRADLIRYPFLLRPGLWVYLYLPEPLTPRDVEKLTDYLHSLVLMIPDTPEGR